MILTWVRDRLTDRLTAHHDDDAGMSLVEILVAISVLSICLFGMLGTLIASAQSIRSQQQRAGASRQVGAQIEQARTTLKQMTYAQLEAAAGTPSVATQTGTDGTVYTTTTTVTLVDAQTGGAMVSGQPTVARAVSRVTWTASGNAREVVFETAIAPDDPAIAPTSGPGPSPTASPTPAPTGTAAPTPTPTPTTQAITSTNLNPAPTQIDASGNPTQEINATVVLEGFDATALVSISWPNDGGGTATRTLTSSDGGITWTTAIPTTQVTHALPPGGTAQLLFTVTAGSLSQPYGLQLQGEAVVAAPTVSGDSSSAAGAVIYVADDNNCGNANHCRNTQAVLFTATTTNLDPATDGVRLKYQLWDGAFAEVSLVWSAANSRWEYTFAADTVKFKWGGAQEFLFTAVRTSDGQQVSYSLPRQVVRT